jgi:hypothetical protein
MHTKNYWSRQCISATDRTRTPNGNRACTRGIRSCCHTHKKDWSRPYPPGLTRTIVGTGIPPWEVGSGCPHREPGADLPLGEPEAAHTHREQGAARPPRDLRPSCPPLERTVSNCPLQERIGATAHPRAELCTSGDSFAFYRPATCS